MSYKRQSPARDGARQQSSTHVQDTANIAKPGIAQLVARPSWQEIETFDGTQYSEPFEDALTTAIGALIVDLSTCADRPNAVFIRQIETINACINVAARFVAMDPNASPTQIRKGTEKIAKKLRSLALEMARDGTAKDLILPPGPQGKGWAS